MGGAAARLRRHPSFVYSSIAEPIMHLTKSLPSLSLRRRIGALFAGLIAANIGVWVWAFSLFHAQPLMLGTAVLAVTLSSATPEAGELEGRTAK